MLNCFLFEKSYLHYALRDFDSILLHCTKLFIRQNNDREQIFDVTFETPPPIEKSCERLWSLKQYFSSNYLYNFRFKYARNAITYIGNNS